MINIRLDEVDKQILDILIDNARTPYTDIAKSLIISPGKKNGGCWCNQRIVIGFKL